MRNAPAVSALLDDGRRERGAITAAHGLTGLLLAAWLAALAELSFVATLALAAGCAAALAAVGAWLAARALPADGIALRWDGQGWSLLTAAPQRSAAVEVALVRVERRLDLGAWLLLRLQPATAAPRWQVLRAARVGAAWHGLRLALLLPPAPTLPAADRPQPR